VDGWQADAKVDRLASHASRKPKLDCRFCAFNPRTTVQRLRSMAVPDRNPSTLPPPRSAVALHAPRAMRPAKRFVYILKNERQPPRYYTGLTADVGARLLAHNDGHCRHTASGTPWHVDVIVEFADEQRAVAFERYLKSGSGGAFAKRHLR
jgi:putative endonuclease